MAAVASKPHHLKLFFSNQYCRAQVVRILDGTVVADACSWEPKAKEQLQSTSDKVQPRDIMAGPLLDSFNCTYFSSPLSQAVTLKGNLPPSQASFAPSATTWLRLQEFIRSSVCQRVLADDISLVAVRDSYIPDGACNLNQRWQYTSCPA